MEKNLGVSLLLDVYGEMLTDNQREVIELYYNEDLSLAEIAQNSGITRQGVRDAIKRGESYLFELESKLKFVEKQSKLTKDMENITHFAQNIDKINQAHYFSRDIKHNVDCILQTVKQLEE